MSSVSEINKTGMMTDLQTRVKLNSLQHNVNYPIHKLIKCETQFGRQILAKLEECSVFLPKRISNAIDDACLEDMNKKQLMLVVRGQIQTKNGATPLVEFIEV